MPEQLFSVSSPLRSYRSLPMVLTVKDLEKPGEQDWSLEDTDTGEQVRLQPEGGWWSKTAWLRLVMPHIGRGQTKTFRLKRIDKVAARAELRASGADELDVFVDGDLMTRYHTGKQWARPFLWPLNGPEGTPLTRSWPIEEDPNEKTDHKHHKSVWIAHGDLNGSDNWSEEPGSGRVEHEVFVDRVSGPVFGRFSTKENWLNAAGERIMRSYTEVTAYALPPDERVLDFIICFRALDKPVKFGDTKEGGLLSVRLTASMNGDRGGIIENAYGGITEKECWGKPAPWVDYSGPVGDTVYGVAMFDHPENPCYPTRWHVRDYGLFTANPFALHDYLGRDDVDGSMTLEPGQVWKFQYRLYLHKGNAADGDVRNRYLGYISPPVIAPVEA